MKEEWVSVIGQNGLGKSTLAKLLNGLFLPESGKITVNDTMVLSEETVWDVRKQIGMVFQNPDNQFVGTTVQDDVVFGLENIGMPRELMIERPRAGSATCSYGRFPKRKNPIRYLVDKSSESQ